MMRWFPNGIGTQAVLAVVVVACYCGVAIYTGDAGGLKEATFMALAFYFGKKSENGRQT